MGGDLTTERLQLSDLGGTTAPRQAVASLQMGHSVEPNRGCGVPGYLGMPDDWDASSWHHDFRDHNMAGGTLT